MSTTVTSQEEFDAAVASGATGIVIDSPAGERLRIDGSADISEIRGESTIEYIRGNAKIEYVCGDPKIGRIDGDAKIGGEVANGGEPGFGRQCARCDMTGDLSADLLVRGDCATQIEDDGGAHRSAPRASVATTAVLRATRPAALSAAIPATARSELRSAKPAKARLPASVRPRADCTTTSR